MLENTADIKKRRLTQTTVLVPGKGVIAVFKNRLVDMHAAPVITNQGLGHKGRCHPVCVRYVVDAIFVNLGLVCFGNKRIELHPNLALSSGAHLMVMHFDPQPHVFHRQTHAGAHIVQRIDRRNRKITAFYAWTMSRVALFIIVARTPGSLN